MAALLFTSGRTLYDVHDMARTRDDLAMSKVWAEAVWCNVTVWIALGMPLYGAMLGVRYCRIAIAILSIALVALLLVLLRSGNHVPNFWMGAILSLQIVGTILFFVPSSNAFFRQRAADRH